MLKKIAINYFDTKLTNVLEGINSKIQLAKRRIRGRNIKNFIYMIRLICGKLKIC